MPFDFLDDLNGQIGASVKHGQQNTLHTNALIHTALNRPHSGHQLCQALQRVVFALQRHKKRISRTERVERQQSERRRTVNENKVIILTDLVEHHFQAIFPMFQLN